MAGEVKQWAAELRDKLGLQVTGIRTEASKLAGQLDELSKSLSALAGAREAGIAAYIALEKRLAALVTEVKNYQKPGAKKPGSTSDSDRRSAFADQLKTLAAEVATQAPGIRNALDCIEGLAECKREFAAFRNRPYAVNGVLVLTPLVDQMSKIASPPASAAAAKEGVELVAKFKLELPKQEAARKDTAKLMDKQVATYPDYANSFAEAKQLYDELSASGVGIDDALGALKTALDAARQAGNPANSPLKDAGVVDPLPSSPVQYPAPGQDFVKAQEILKAALPKRSELEKTSGKAREKVDGDNPSLQALAQAIVTATPLLTPAELASHTQLLNTARRVLANPGATSADREQQKQRVTQAVTLLKDTLPTQRGKLRDALVNGIALYQRICDQQTQATREGGGKPGAAPTIPYEKLALALNGLQRARAANDAHEFQNGIDALDKEVIPYVSVKVERKANQDAQDWGAGGRKFQALTEARQKLGKVGRDSITPRLGERIAKLLADGTAARDARLREDRGWADFEKELALCGELQAAAGKEAEQYLALADQRKQQGDLITSLGQSTRAAIGKLADVYKAQPDLSPAEELTTALEQLVQQLQTELRAALQSSELPGESIKQSFAPLLERVKAAMSPAGLEDRQSRAKLARLFAEIEKAIAQNTLANPSLAREQGRQLALLHGQSGQPVAEQLQAAEALHATLAQGGGDQALVSKRQALQTQLDDLKYRGSLMITAQKAKTHVGKSRFTEYFDTLEKRLRGFEARLASDSLKALEQLEKELKEFETELGNVETAQKSGSMSHYLDDDFDQLDKKIADQKDLLGKYAAELFKSINTSLQAIKADRFKQDPVKLRERLKTLSTEVDGHVRTAQERQTVSGQIDTLLKTIDGNLETIAKLDATGLGERISSAVRGETKKAEALLASYATRRKAIVEAQGTGSTLAKAKTLAEALERDTRQARDNPEQALMQNGKLLADQEKTRLQEVDYTKRLSLAENLLKRTRALVVKAGGDTDAIDDVDRLIDKAKASGKAKDYVEATRALGLVEARLKSIADNPKGSSLGARGNLVEDAKLFELAAKQLIQQLDGLKPATQSALGKLPAGVEPAIDKAVTTGKGTLVPTLFATTARDLDNRAASDAFRRAQREELLSQARAFRQVLTKHPVLTGLIRNPVSPAVLSEARKLEQTLSRVEANARRAVK